MVEVQHSHLFEMLLTKHASIGPEVLNGMERHILGQSICKLVFASDEIDFCFTTFIELTNIVISDFYMLGSAVHNGVHRKENASLIVKTKRSRSGHVVTKLFSKVSELGHLMTSVRSHFVFHFS